MHEIECLLGESGNLFLEKGIRENSEPNGFGYFIESLKDPLSNAFYDTWFTSMNTQY